MILALSYGASFMLPDGLRAAGLSPSSAGSMIGAGTLATLIGALSAGRVARRMGLMAPVVGAAAVMGFAMACFAAIGEVGAAAGYIGGVLLGLGWAVAYILMPVQVIQCLGPSARLEALMLLSGAQMVGIGLSAPIGRVLATGLGGIGRAFAVDALLCAVAVVWLIVAARGFRGIRQPPVRTVAIDLPTVRAIMRHATAFPVIMIGLAACSFSGLSTFQSLLAQAHGVPPEAFFLTFTATTVALRLSAASRIGRFPLPLLTLALAVAMLIGLIGLATSGDHILAWIAATFVFSVGYGLNYSALNALVVGLAEQHAIAVPVTSQVFTVGYFVGLFGFPLIAERTMALAGVDALLAVLAVFALANLALALIVVVRARPARHAAGSS